ncbi:MAG: thiol-disulfide isomerase/thioredoxin [Myxococcota bacterium]
MSWKRRLEKRLTQARSVAKRVVEDLPLDKGIDAARDLLRRGGLDLPGQPPSANKASVQPRPVATPPPAVESPLTDVVATADRALLMGLTGLRMALEPQGRPMLVNHWATWCSGCTAELPLLVTLRERWRGKADFIGVGWEGFTGGSDPTQLVRDVERVSLEQGVDWATLIFEGPPEQLWTALNLSNHQIPQTLVLHPDGHIMVHHCGELDTDAINKIEAALREASIATGR